MTNNNEEILIAIMEEVQNKINDIHSIMQNILIEEAADDLEEKNNVPLPPTCRT